MPRAAGRDGDQPPLDGMPQRLYPATPARLSTYDDCPRRYRLTYLDRPAVARGRAWAHRSVGAAVHTALARWWGLPLRARTPRAGGALLGQAWPTEGFRDEDQSRRARVRVRAEVEGYLAGVDPAAEPVAVERSIAVRTPHAWLWGRLDRLDDRAGDGLVVVDYKTGTSVPGEEAAAGSQALAVYAAGAAGLMRRRCRRVELHHLPSGTVAAFEHTEATLAAHLDRADAVSAELDRLDAVHAGGLSRKVADAAFPARVAPRCGWCEVRSLCGPGSVVPPREPWAGVPEA